MIPAPSPFHQVFHSRQKLKILRMESADTHCPHQRESINLEKKSESFSTRRVLGYMYMQLSHLLTGVSVPASVLIAAILLPGVVELGHFLKTL